MKAVIFCGGDIDDYTKLRQRCFDDNLIMCADSGLRHTEALGIKPDIIIGDNDSWTEEYPKASEVFVYPSKKDFTDTQLCVDCAIKRGCTEIEILGGFGGRHDHEYSHYCLMLYSLNKGVRVKMCDEHNDVWMEDKPFTLNKSSRRYVSFFPFGGDVEGFSVSGLKYSAKDITLSCGRVQATSNEFAQCDRAEINFKSGVLLVMLCDDR